MRGCVERERDIPNDLTGTMRQEEKKRVRAEIRAEILGIRAFDGLERKHIEDALGWVDSGVDLCRVEKPATPPKHLVSYFAVVDGDWILLVDHKNARLWLPTGGHVEPGEHPRTTVVRELREELGLSSIHKIEPSVFLTCGETTGRTAGHIDVSLWYIVRISRDTPFEFDQDEFNDAKWFKRDEIPFERSDPNMERFINKLP